MEKKYTNIIIAILAVSLLLNIKAISGISTLKKDFNNRISNLENNLSNMQREIYNTQQSTVEVVKGLLKEENSIVKEKKHTVLNFNKEAKSSEVMITITLKEIQQDSKVYLKEDISGTSNNILMDNLSGTTYGVKRTYILDDVPKLSIIIKGASIKEEYLFDFSLKNLLESRILIANGGTSVGFLPDKDTISYSQDFSIRNNYQNDVNLLFSKVIATVEANEKVIFNKEYNKDYSPSNPGQYFGNLPYNKFDENGFYSEEIKIDILNESGSLENRGFQLEDGTNLKIIINVTDNLGLTYEYLEAYTVSKTDGLRPNENMSKDSYGFKLKY